MRVLCVRVVSETDIWRALKLNAVICMCQPQQFLQAKRSGIRVSSNKIWIRKKVSYALVVAHLSVLIGRDRSTTIVYKS